MRAVRLHTIMIWYQLRSVRYTIWYAELINPTANASCAALLRYDTVSASCVYMILTHLKQKIVAGCFCDPGFYWDWYPEAPDANEEANFTCVIVSTLPCPGDNGTATSTAAGSEVVETWTNGTAGNTSKCVIYINVTKRGRDCPGFKPCKEARGTLENPCVRCPRNSDSPAGSGSRADCFCQVGCVCVCVCVCVKGARGGCLIVACRSRLDWLEVVRNTCTLDRAVCVPRDGLNDDWLAELSNTQPWSLCSFVLCEFVLIWLIGCGFFCSNKVGDDMTTEAALCIQVVFNVFICVRCMYAGPTRQASLHYAYKPSNVFICVCVRVQQDRRACTMHTSHLMYSYVYVCGSNKTGELALCIQAI